MTSKNRRLFVLAFSALLVPMAAIADCVDATREPTAAEQDFYNRSVAALMAALPAVPQGVTLEARTYDLKKMPTMNVLCKEQKIGQFDVSLGLAYVLKYSEEDLKLRGAERRWLSQQIDATLVMPPEKNAQKQALRKQEESARSAAYVARKAGDSSGAAAKEAESDALYKQIEELQRKHNAEVKPQQEALRKRMDAVDVDGLQAEIRLAINQIKLPSNAGANSGAFGVDSPGRSAALKVNNVVWSVRGKDSPLRDTLQSSLDRNLLQTLVGKTLPTLAESQAQWTKAAVPAIAVAAFTPSPQAQVPGSTTAPAKAAESVPTSNASASVQAVANAALPTPTPVPANPVVAPIAEPLKKANDAVNLLRGMFGR